MNHFADKPYYSLDCFLKEQFGEKIYKIAIDAGRTCPVRDGTLDTRGCLFCSAGGSGEFAAHGSSISEQLRDGMNKFGDKQVGRRFIAYFQSFTNTYAPTEVLRRQFSESLAEPSVAGISIETRLYQRGMHPDAPGTPGTPSRQIHLGGTGTPDDS